MNPNKLSEPSLFASLNTILGYDSDREESNMDLEHEIDQLPLPPWTEPEARTNWWSQWRIPVLTLAPLLAILLLVIPSRFNEQVVIRAKGQNKVSVYVQRSGAVLSFKEAKAIRSGDRIQAEVIASAKLTAYWGIRDRKGALISSFKALLASELSISQGQAQSFSNSFALDEQIEGEVAAVLLCQSPLTSEFDRLRGPEAPTFKEWSRTIADCKVIEIKLRD